MNFLGYLLLGAVVYVTGFMINHKILKPKKPKGVTYSIKTPIIWQCVLGCFVVMLAVSALLSLFVLKHETLDVAYVFVNSVVGAVVFYFGINPDENYMELPK